MQDFFNELLSNRILWTAFMGYFGAQIIKAVIEAVISRSFSIKRLLTGNGGMPSSHSATVCSLATITAFDYGVASFEFAIAIIFAIVVMTDASGVRRETGKQAVAINELIEYFSKLRSDMPKPHFSEKSLKELIGHTPLQVQVGATLGIIIGVIVRYVW